MKRKAQMPRKIRPERWSHQLNLTKVDFLVVFSLSIDIDCEMGEYLHEYVYAGGAKTERKIYSVMVPSSSFVLLYSLYLSIFGIKTKSDTV